MRVHSTSVGRLRPSVPWRRRLVVLAALGVARAAPRNDSSIYTFANGVRVHRAHLMPLQIERSRGRVRRVGRARRETAARAGTAARGGRTSTSPRRRRGSWASSRPRGPARFLSTSARRSGPSPSHSPEARRALFVTEATGQVLLLPRQEAAAGPRGPRGQPRRALPRAPCRERGAQRPPRRRRVGGAAGRRRAGRRAARGGRRDRRRGARDDGRRRLREPGLARGAAPGARGRAAGVRRFRRFSSRYDERW